MGASGVSGPIPDSQGPMINITIISIIPISSSGVGSQL